MVKSHKLGAGAGYGMPPHDTRFKPGKSGNPKGRPKGSRNFATVMEEELNDRVPLTENGKPRKISKRQVIVKQAVNKAAGGDLRAIQTIFNQVRLHEGAAEAHQGAAALDTPEDLLVIAEIVRRIRQSDERPQPLEKDTGRVRLKKKGDDAARERRQGKMS